MGEGLNWPRAAWQSQHISNARRPAAEDRTMPEARGRRDSQPTKIRSKDRADDYQEEEERGENNAPPPEPAPYRDDNFTGGFDEETNNRYEEIKRGTTHISELQQMTMP